MPNVFIADVIIPAASASSMPPAAARSNVDCNAPAEISASLNPPLASSVIASATSPAEKMVDAPKSRANFSKFSIGRFTSPSALAVCDMDDSNFAAVFVAM